MTKILPNSILPAAQVSLQEVVGEWIDKKHTKTSAENFCQQHAFAKFFSWRKFPLGYMVLICIHTLGKMIV